MGILNIKIHAVFLPLMMTIFCGVPGTSAAKPESCGGNKNLFEDHSFTRIHEGDGLWVYTQHTGNPSFDLLVSDGELEIRRIDQEPWMILAQSVTDASFGGATVRFSVELKGNAPAQPRIHGFSHVAGLYLKMGHRRDVILADHNPNSGTWDWQAVTLEKAIPEGITNISVGFVHQSGGSIWARNPILEFADCSEIEN